MSSGTEYLTWVQARLLSCVAVLVSSAHLFYIYGQWWPLAYVFAAFALNMVGQRARTYKRLGQPQGLSASFGMVYFIALAMVCGGLLLLENGFQKRLIPNVYWPLVALVASLFVWLCAAISAFGGKWFLACFTAPVFGDPWEEAATTSSAVIQVTNSEHWKPDHGPAGHGSLIGHGDGGHDSRTGVSLELDAPAYVCTLCGAYCHGSADRCEACDEYGTDYIEHLVAPRRVLHKLEAYRQSPSPEEPVYEAGRPPLIWRHKCGLCGARCAGSDVACWFCEEKGRRWGENARRTCPFTQTPDPQPQDRHDNGSDSLSNTRDLRPATHSPERQTMSKWILLASDGTEQPPVDDARLLDLARTGVLKPTDYVRKADQAAPTQAGRIRGLFPTAGTGTPPTVTQQSHQARQDIRPAAAVPKRPASQGNDAVTAPPTSGIPAQVKWSDPRVILAYIVTGVMLVQYAEWKGRSRSHAAGSKTKQVSQPESPYQQGYVYGQSMGAKLRSGKVQETMSLEEFLEQEAVRIEAMCPYDDSELDKVSEWMRGYMEGATAVLFPRKGR